MCVSEGFGGFHDSQPSRFKDLASTLLYFHSAINLYIQDPEFVRNQSFRFSGPSAHYKPDNLSYLDVERYC